MPSLSEQALQMESLITALIPFKTKQIEQWIALKGTEVENLRIWYDRHIDNLKDELKILIEHQEALGLNLPPEASMTSSEIRASNKILETSGINDDPMAALRAIKAGEQ